MEVIYRDQVIARGTHSLAVKLPSMLVKLLGIKKGSKVNYCLEGGLLVLKFDGVIDAQNKEVETF